MIKFNKKLYSMISAILLVVIMVATLVASFMPMFTVKASATVADETFSGGSYTKGIVPDDVNYGIIDAVKLIPNLKYITHVISVQENERQIDYYNDRKTEILADLTMSWESKQNSIDSYNKIISGYEKNIADLIAELTEEEKEELTALLKDASFINQLAIIYSITGLFSDAAFESAGMDDDFNTFYMLRTVFGIISFVIILLFAVLLAVASVITLVVKGIYAIATIKHADQKVLDRLFPKSLNSIVLIILVMAVLSAILLGGASFSIGSGLIFLIILAVVSSAIRGLNTVVLDENCTVSALTKWLCAILCTVFVLVTLFSFLNVGVFNKTLDNGIEFYSSEYNNKRFEVHKEAYMKKNPEPVREDFDSNSDYLAALAKYPQDVEGYAKASTYEDRLSAYKSQIVVPFIYELITGVVIVVAFGMSVELLGRKIYKNKRTGAVTEANMSVKNVIVAAILVVAMILPGMLFTVPKYEDLKKGYAEGEIKIQFNAFEEKNTPAYIAVNAGKEGIKVAEELLKELDEQIEAATDEAAKAELVFQKENGQRMINMYNDQLDYMTTSESKTLALCTVMSVLTLVLCVAYMIVPGILDKKLPQALICDSSECAAPAEETAPVEETPAEDDNKPTEE